MSLGGDADWLVVRSCSSSKLAEGHYSLSQHAVVIAEPRPIDQRRYSPAAAECRDLPSLLLWMCRPCAAGTPANEQPIAEQQVTTTLAAEPSPAAPTCLPSDVVPLRRLCPALRSYRDVFVAVQPIISAIASVDACGAQAIRTDCSQWFVVRELLSAFVQS